MQAHVFVSGRVQGVSFRSFTVRNAHSLGLKGWVRNLPDGRVEAIIQGDEESIKAMIKIMKKGPSVSIVEDIEIEWEEIKEKFSDFARLN